MTISPIFSNSGKSPDSVMRVEQGNKFWRNAKGQLHRTDGPAIEGADGFNQWWIEGKILTEKEFNACTLAQKDRQQKEVAKDAADKAEYDRRMRQVIRDFHAKIGRRP